MCGETENIVKISLEGDWSVKGVAQQFPLLRQRLAKLLTKTDIVPELDLKGITELDACGCQLLALFVRNLRQLGALPVCDGISQRLSAKLRVLGFDDELGAQIGFSRDCP